MVAILPPSLTYVEVGFVMLFAVFAEHMLHIREYLLSKRIYFYASFGTLLLASILILANIDWSKGLVLARAISGNQAHALTWITLLSIAWIFGYKDVIRGVVISLAFGAFHELISVTFTIVTGAYGAEVALIQALTYYSTFYFLLGCVILAYFVFDGRRTLKYMVWATALLVAYSIIVYFSVGTVGTLDLTGPTRFFYSQLMNGIEEISWVLPSLVLIVASLFGRDSSGIFDEPEALNNPSAVPLAMVSCSAPKKQRWIAHYENKIKAYQNNLASGQPNGDMIGELNERIAKAEAAIIRLKTIPLG